MGETKATVTTVAEPEPSPSKDSANPEANPSPSAAQTEGVEVANAPREKRTHEIQHNEDK